MKVGTIRKMMDTLSFGALVLYVLDIILLGTGLVTKVYGPFSSRMLFFGVAILAAIPRIWEHRRELLRNKSLILFGVFLLYAFGMAIYGYLNGNRVDIMVQDLKGYINMAILPVMMVMLDSKERINSFLKYIFCGSLFIALLSFLFSFLCFFPSGISTYLMDRLTVYGITQLTYLTGNVTRVFFDTGTRYMFTAFIIGFYFIVSKKKPNKYVVLGCAVMMASLFISYTRGIYFGAFISAFFALVLIRILAKGYLKNAIKSMAIIVVIAVMLLSGLSLLQKENLFYVGYWRTVTGLSIDTSDWVDSENSNIDDEMDSLKIRKMRKDNAIKAIKKSPFIGHGLGYAVDKKNGYIEYFYHDLCAKTGFVGLILFLSPLLVLLLELFKKRKTVGEHTLMFQSLMFVSSLFVFIISYFNPCMNSTVGLSVFSLSIAAINPANRWDIKPEVVGELNNGEQ